MKNNNAFRFIDDLLSLNEDSTFEKHCKDIYPTELELKKENNNYSCASFLDIYIYIENGEFHTKLFDKADNYGSIGAEFLRICRATSKTEDLSGTCKQLLSQMLKKKWANEENQIFLNKNNPTLPRSFH